MEGMNDQSKGISSVGNDDGRKKYVSGSAFTYITVCLKGDVFDFSVTVIRNLSFIGTELLHMPSFTSGTTVIFAA